MRIGIDARMLTYTGIGRYVTELVTRVPVLDQNNAYIIFLRPEDLQSFVIPSANVTAVSGISTIYNIQEQTTFRRIVEGQHLDLLHVPHFNAPLWYRGKLILTIHDLIQAFFASTTTLRAHIKKIGYNFAIKHNVKKAYQVITVSEHTKHDVARWCKIDEDRIAVIHNGVSDKFCRTKLDPKRMQEILTGYGIKQPYLLYVGLHSPHKNLARLIETMAILRRCKSEVQLVLAGKEDARYTPWLREQVNKLGLGQNVVFTGYVDDSMLTTLFLSAALFVFPSLYEGFGLPPLEAMACGVPVVSSQATSLPEVLGEAAVFFDPTSIDNMADKITEVLDDPEQRSAMVQKGHEQTKRFRWERMAEETLRVYREAMG
jgi:glycosyltransferase involved in cell wall biosynthesis